MSIEKTFYISVIQPVYNASKYLDSSINSVLTQTYSEFEYILIDDGSTDDSNLIISNYAKIDKRIKLISLSENKGYNYALNYAINCSKGNYLFRIDSDDILGKDALFNRISVFRKNPSTVLVSGNSIVFTNNKPKKGVNIFAPRTYEVINWMLIWGNPITHSSAMFSKDLFEKCGSYIQLKNLEDWSLWNKFKKHGEIVIVNKEDIFYRFHENQSTKGNFKNPIFKQQVSQIINQNLQLSITSNNAISDTDSWALYTNSSSIDLDIKCAESAVEVLEKSKDEFKKIYKMNTVAKNEFDFFLFLQKMRIYSRINITQKRVSCLLFCIINNFPKLILFNLNLTIQYLTYLFKIHNFNKKNNSH